MNNKNNTCLQIIVIPITGIIFWFIMKYIYLWVPNFASFLDNFKAPLKESNTLQIIGLIVFIIIAIGLYNLKKRLIIVFALIQIMGGIWTIWSTFTQSFENSVLYALAIAGGVFLLVKGFDNFMKYNTMVNNKD